MSRSHCVYFAFVWVWVSSVYMWISLLCFSLFFALYFSSSFVSFALSLYFVCLYRFENVFFYVHYYLCRFYCFICCICLFNALCVNIACHITHICVLCAVCSSVSLHVIYCCSFVQNRPNVRACMAVSDNAVRLAGLRIVSLDNIQVKLICCGLSPKNHILKLFRFAAN